MTRKQKLELTWVEKEHRPKLEPRILLEDTTHCRIMPPGRVSDTDIFENMLDQTVIICWRSRHWNKNLPDKRDAFISIRLIIPDMPSNIMMMVSNTVFGSR